MQRCNKKGCPYGQPLDNFRWCLANAKHMINLQPEGAIGQEGDNEPNE